MIVKSYKAKVGSHLTDKDAERIGKFLEKKMGKVGKDAEEVVRAAQPSHSPIHRDFEWNDEIAGHQYRLEQARKIIRSIMVVYTNGKSTEPTRAFHHVVIAQDEVRRSAYVPAAVVWETPDYASQVIENARRELETWSIRYREYESLAKAAALVDEALLAIA